MSEPKSPHSIGLMWWMLAREVLRLRGVISRGMPWEVMPDLFFYRDPEAVEKEENERAENEQVMKSGEVTSVWRTGPLTVNPPPPPPLLPLPWPPSPDTSDWAAASTETAAPAPNWGGSNQW